MSRRVLIVDDHPVIRSGLDSALKNAGFEVCAHAGSKSEAFAQIAHTNPDLILLDLNLPDGSGFEVCTWARNLSATIGIVILTLNDSPEFLLAALAAKASGYVLKSAPITEVIATLERALITPLSFTASGLAQAISAKAKLQNLTVRELEVITHLARGLSSKEIATSLFLGEATVKSHLINIYRKLGVTNRTAAVYIARSNSWVAD
jgi:DNA-binding NarL/FixJ family response regulator